MTDEYIEGIMNRDNPNWKPSDLTSQPEERIHMKKQPIKNKIIVVTPLMLIDNEIFDAKDRLIAKVWREDVGEALLVSLNSQPDLLTACKNALPLISGMRIKNDAFRPETDIERHLDKLIRKSEEELETVIAKVEKKGDKSG